MGGCTCARRATPTVTESARALPGNLPGVRFLEPWRLLGTLNLEQLPLGNASIKMGTIFHHSHSELSEELLGLAVQIEGYLLGRMGAEAFIPFHHSALLRRVS